MASISNVVLEIFEGPPVTTTGRAQVRVSYTITADHHDAEHEQSYREQVQLFGDDRAEGGQRELIPDPDGTIWDGVVTFTTSQVQFTFIREKNIPSSSLDEDPGPPVLEDEIGALVTLTPLPPALVSRESNIISRGGIVVDPGLSNATLQKTGLTTDV